MAQQSKNARIAQTRRKQVKCSRHVFVELALFLVRQVDELMIRRKDLVGDLMSIKTKFV